MTSKQTDFDVLIVGGGLVGASLAYALSCLPLSIAIVEAIPSQTLTKDDFDARSIALSLGSQRILNSCGLWDDMSPHATAMHDIHISEKGQFGAVRLKAHDYNYASLGSVIEMQHLNQVLAQKLASKKNITLFNPYTLEKISQDDSKATVAIRSFDGELKHYSTKLLIAADGARSSVRQLLMMKIENKSYYQHALVANIGLNRPHHGQAYERFTPNGPVALLPMTKQRSSLVWVSTKTHIDELISLNERDFLKQLQLQFGYRLGRFTKSGKRACFPLHLAFMPEQIKGRTIFIGNAAHNLHPVAGQGFNLGLRDVAYLAQVIATHINALGEHEMLAAYLASRKDDHKRTINFTDKLISTFSMQQLGCLRSMGFLTLDAIFPAKKLLMHYATGFGGDPARLTCGLPLTDKENPNAL